MPITDQKRKEIAHIDEVTRTARSTVQWFLEKRNADGTHPITHNNKLTVFICGEESFADIADQIRNAKESIDICCWGFDPGMELVRNRGGVWPRGETFGDLLIAAGKRGVKVRLLVWYDAVAVKLPGANPRNMPGYTHGKWPWRLRSGSNVANALSAQNSIDLLNAAKKDIKDASPLMAREEYCHTWFNVAFANLLNGISIRTRAGNADKITNSLASERMQPEGLASGEGERGVMVRGGTHHQKPILIDFTYQDGRKAVGYVMGLNSITDYWDTIDHKLDDPRREQCGDNDPGYHRLKPYRDYACRIDAGGALVSLYRNFVTAWDDAVKDMAQTAQSACTSRELSCHGTPPALARKAGAGDSTVQIVRTQPQEGDKSIKEAYFQATDIATLAARYLYIENQYFQYEEWAQHLTTTRKEVIAGWKRGCAKGGKTNEDMPIMHVFIVIPVPERQQMIPRTYDALATLGQQGAMKGQVALIGSANKAVEAQEELSKQHLAFDAFGRPVAGGYSVPAAVEHANSISKPDAKILESQFGLKVSVAMLNVCEFEGEAWRYREIYIHSKLLLVDDCFFTVGSANLNQRSMAVDSEINLATDDRALAQDLRRRIWMQQSGGKITGNGGTKADIVTAFYDWGILMDANKKKKFANSNEAGLRKMDGFLLPLEDDRSSTTRLG